MKSFSLLRTNVGLSANVKIVVDSESKISLDSIDSDPILSSSSFKKRPVSPSDYIGEIYATYFRSFPKELIFKIKFDGDKSLMFQNFENQIDSLYFSGSSNIGNNKDYLEEFEFFSPLWIERNGIPKCFVIFRVDDPGLVEITRNNFREQILDKLKFVKCFDLKGNNSISEWLKKNYEDNDQFPTSSLWIDFRDSEFSYWTGIDLSTGLFTTKSSILNSFLSNEQTYFDFQKMVFEGWANSGIIHPNILNLSFLFDDEPATKNTLRRWTLNRYYGFYFEDIEEVKGISFYQPQNLSPNILIDENNFLTSTSSSSPFLEEWRIRDYTWIQIRGDFYKVERVISNEIQNWKIIAATSFSGLTSSSLNTNIWTVNTNNELKLRNTEYPCDPQLPEQNINIDNFSSVDIWGISIDDSFYRIHKNSSGSYYIISDGGFRFTNDIMEYYINFPEESGITKIDLLDENGKPKIFKIYKFKFLDIKDFDIDVIDTVYSRYQYEFESSLNIKTDEPKFYLRDFKDKSNPKDFERFNLSNEITYLPSSSEYTSNLETFKIDGADLTDIWRKNPIFLKWGWKNSQNTNDYPYLLNNSLLSDEFNRSPNSFNSIVTRSDRNLDYFYTINADGHSYSFHSLHVSDSDRNFYFDIGSYFSSSSDYFVDFFGKTFSFNLINVQGSRKWSKFNTGRSDIPNLTLFQGIKFALSKVDSIDVSGQSIQTLNLLNDNYFDDWKFSILLDSSEFRFFTVEQCLLPCFAQQSRKVIKIPSYIVPADILSATYGFIKGHFDYWKIIKESEIKSENFTYSGELIPNICNYTYPYRYTAEICGNTSTNTYSILIPGYISASGWGFTQGGFCWQYSNPTIPELDCLGVTTIGETYSLASNFCQFCQDNNIGQYQTTTTTTTYPSMNVFGYTPFTLSTTTTSTTTIPSTPTPTITDTPTETPTQTPTQTPTETPTPTNTETPGASPPETPTETPTPTNTQTPTETPTNTPTNTQTPSNTPTNTQTPTETTTETPTKTPTETPTPTNTDTPTETPTQTPTNTETPTETPTRTPTETPTETPTPTNTDTPTETPT